MAGAFSTHLINSFNPANQRHSSFAQRSDESQISIYGPMSFNRQMHGMFPSQANFSMLDNGSVSMTSDISEETAVKIAALQAKLNKQLGPEFISTRPGPGGGPKFTYAEGWKIINLANEVFGFNGWSTSVVNMTTDFVDFSEETRRYSIGVTAIVRVTLRDGVFHEDVGYGMLENSKSKGMALDKCKKEAVTDAVKRALRNFGNLLGNCLYDKHYTQEISKVKVQPPKFDKDGLHRRPEFEESKPNIKDAPASCVVNSTDMKGKTPVHPRDTRPNVQLSNAQTNTNNKTSTSNNPPQQQNQQHSKGPPVPVAEVAPRPVRRSLPPPPVPDMDDAYNFPSEDDAFLAGLDFEELEADLGRPIDYEHGMTTEAGIDISESSEGASASKRRHNQGGPVDNTEKHGFPRSHNVFSTCHVPTTNSTRSSIQDQNLALGQQKPNSGGSGEHQSRSKSFTGTSNLSAGLNQQNHRQPSVAAQSNGAQRNNGSGGVKRAADTLHQQPAGARRVSPGMGLSNALGASTSSSSGRREPLTTLYVDSGASTGGGRSDSKRMKL